MTDAGGRMQGMRAPRGIAALVRKHDDGSQKTEDGCWVTDELPKFTCQTSPIINQKVNFQSHSFSHTQATIIRHPSSVTRHRSPIIRCLSLVTHPLQKKHLPKLDISFLF
jgi:hypothetical protein